MKTRYTATYQRTTESKVEERDAWNLVFLKLWLGYKLEQHNDPAHVSIFDNDTNQPVYFEDDQNVMKKSVDD